MDDPSRRPTPGIAFLFYELIKLIGGDPHPPPRSGLAKLFYDSSRPHIMESFEMDFPLNPMRFHFETTLRANYPPEGAVTDPDAEVAVRWMAVKIMLAIDLMGPPTIEFELEVTIEIDIEKDTTMLLKARVFVGIQVTSMMLELAVMVGGGAYHVTFLFTHLHARNSVKLHVPQIKANE